MSVPSRLVGASRMVGAAARAAAVAPAPAQTRRFGSSPGPTTSDILAGRTKYGGRTTVTLVPGDGVGPELAAITRQVFKVRWLGGAGPTGCGQGSECKAAGQRPCAAWTLLL